MRIVRGRAEVRRFPSRHNSALFRLFAYLRLRNTRPEPTDAILVIDRHQSNLETGAMTSWMTLTFACYLAALCFDRWPLALALLVSIPLAIALLQVPALISAVMLAPAWRAITGNRGDSIAFNNSAVMLMFVGASVYFAMQRTWVRFVGWQFLLMLALNAIAAVIVFLLRDSIARLEASIGGAPSAR